MSIRARLAALFALATLVLVWAGAALFVSRLQQGLVGNVDQRLETRAASLAAEVAAHHGSLPRRLSSANGIYAQVLDKAGQIVDTSSRLLNRPLLDPHQLRAARARATSSDSTVGVDIGDDTVRQSMRLRGEPLADGSDVLVVATSREDVDTAVHSATVQLVELSGAVTVVAFGGGWLLTRAALRPVERMRREVAALGAGQIAEGIAVPRTRDELARLGRTFNGLLGRLRAAAERERAFISDAGHELRTPLAVLQGELELAQHSGRTREELRDTVAVAAEETERLVRLAEDLLFLARGDEEPARPLAQFDLVALVEQAVRGPAGRARAGAVSVQVTAPASLQVHADRDRIRRALDNVLVNALRFTPPGGVIAVDVRADDTDVVLTVRDTGPGFPEDFLPMAFERFSRAPGQDDAGAQPSGNGLGLAIVRSVLVGLGGTASVVNAAGGGAIVTLRWPPDPGAA
jgi:signal transduction histidine kinase